MIPNFCKTCLCRLDGGPGYCDEHRNDAGKLTSADRREVVTFFSSPVQPVAPDRRHGAVTVASIDREAGVLRAAPTRECGAIYAGGPHACLHPEGHEGQHRAEIGAGSVPSLGPMVAEWDGPALPAVDLSDLPQRTARDGPWRRRSRDVTVLRSKNSRRHKAMAMLDEHATYLGDVAERLAKDPINRWVELQALMSEGKISFEVACKLMTWAVNGR